jgi:hypothetical protein
MLAENKIKYFLNKDEISINVSDQIDQYQIWLSEDENLT